jgi:Concanavalin A-like lectin/glucanases superfamily/VanZ like family
LIIRHSRPVERIVLRVPVFVMVLAATAIPVELRSPTYDALGFSVSASLLSDVLANILGYVPVGIVLWDLGPFRAVTTATVVAIFAETAQLVMAHRDPSIHDVLSNVGGAILGVAIASHCKFHRPALAVSQVKSQIAAALALMIVVAVWMTSDDGMVSTRGVTSPGRLEAYWKLDESSGRIAEDSSGHGISGRFSKEPSRIDSETGRAVLFDGSKDNVHFGFSTALRLAGSMTITAWVKSTSYPIDDAAIVSSILSPDESAFAGYQLDTTVDRGPRTVGFKITNECRRLAARYGATPLLAGTWYHVAGVYDSEARTLDVYLNGELDNGFLLGSVTSAQHSSRSHLYIGTRSDQTGYEFAGFIHDVRIYSRALTAAEILSDMGRNVADALAPERVAGEDANSQRTLPLHESVHTPCAISSDPADKHIPIAAAGVGLLVAVACIGLWPNGGGLLWLLVSLAAGFLLPTSTLPPINLWLVPLTSLAGGLSVVVSIDRRGVAR